MSQNFSTNPNKRIFENEKDNIKKEKEKKKLEEKTRKLKEKELEKNKKIEVENQKLLVKKTKDLESKKADKNSPLLKSPFEKISTTEKTTDGLFSNFEKSFSESSLISPLISNEVIHNSPSSGDILKASISDNSFFFFFFFFFPSYFYK
jgi:hypothetical protein